ncbi:30S ribosomal protein S6 [bacterium]|nr:MAG: 30S ribosomal protein S6 [Candidatus Hinthialibacteria bacterium OLB16]MBK7496754.1 30S ribosomal protein S6 [Candidatus Omnitrophota bacterium]MCK6497785.1 30S ribosomal protein S6 [bacterium]NUP92257.1 30S ribosomal protein S6 [Candidatus Omnitrophota bacterium]
MAVVREFETLYIVVPECNEEEQKKVINNLNEAALKAGAEIIKSDVWGKRKLAYLIKKRSEGVYVLLRTKGPAGIPKELDVHIKRTPEILRHLTTTVTKQQLSEEARLRDIANRRAEDARLAAEAAAKREAEAAAEALAADAQAAAEPVIDNQPTEQAVGE